MNWTNPKGDRVHGFLRGNHLIREDGRIEQMCKHGVGHPIGHLNKWQDSWMGVHGCDGCCSLAEFHLKRPQETKL